jgi:hypothetical protein
MWSECACSDFAPRANNTLVKQLVNNCALHTLLMTLSLLQFYGATNALYSIVTAVNRTVIVGAKRIWTQTLFNLSIRDGFNRDFLYKSADLILCFSSGLVIL